MSDTGAPVPGAENWRRPSAAAPRNGTRAPAAAPPPRGAEPRPRYTDNGDDDDEEEKFVPVEHHVLRKKQDELLAELQVLGYETLDDAMERCKVCWLDIDASSATVALDVDDDGKEDSRNVARGFYLTYVDNVHLQSNIVFALMEQYWTKRHVQVHRRFNREPIELNKAEIQVHYQYCNNDSSIERLKHQLLVLDLMLSAISGSGLFQRESKFGELTGPIRVSIPASKIYSELQKQSLALAHQLGVMISYLRQQYGRPEVAIPATTLAFGKGIFGGSGIPNSGGGLSARK